MDGCHKIEGLSLKTAHATSNFRLISLDQITYHYSAEAEVLNLKMLGPLYLWRRCPGSSDRSAVVSVAAFHLMSGGEIPARTGSCSVGVGLRHPVTVHMASEICGGSYSRLVRTTPLGHRRGPRLLFGGFWRLLPILFYCQMR